MDPRRLQELLQAGFTMGLGIGAGQIRPPAAPMPFTPENMFSAMLGPAAQLRGLHPNGGFPLPFSGPSTLMLDPQRFALEAQLAERWAGTSASAFSVPREVPRPPLVIGSNVIRRDSPPRQVMVPQAPPIARPSSPVRNAPIPPAPPIAYKSSPVLRRPEKKTPAAILPRNVLTTGDSQNALEASGPRVGSKRPSQSQSHSPGKPPSKRSSMGSRGFQRPGSPDGPPQQVQVQRPPQSLEQALQEVQAPAQADLIQQWQAFQQQAQLQAAAAQQQRQQAQVQAQVQQQQQAGLDFLQMCLQRQAVPSFQQPQLDFMQQHLWQQQQAAQLMFKQQQQQQQQQQQEQQQQHHQLPQHLALQQHHLLLQQQQQQQQQGFVPEQQRRQQDIRPNLNDNATRNRAQAEAAALPQGRNGEYPMQDLHGSMAGRESHRQTAPEAHRRVPREALADLNAAPPEEEEEEPPPPPPPPPPQPEIVKPTVEPKVEASSKRRRKAREVPEGKGSLEDPGDPPPLPASRPKGLGRLRGKTGPEPGLEGQPEAPTTPLVAAPVPSATEKNKILRAALVAVTKKLPKNAYAHLFLGLMMQRCCQPGKAVTALQKAVDILQATEEEGGPRRAQLQASVLAHLAQCQVVADVSRPMGAQETAGEGDNEKTGGEEEGGWREEKEAVARAGTGKVKVKVEQGAERNPEGGSLAGTLARLQEKGAGAGAGAASETGVLRTLGVQMLQARRHQDAVTAFSTVLGKAPGDLDSLANLGAAHFHLGEVQQAERCLQAVLLRDAAHPGALPTYGALLLHQHQQQQQQQQQGAAASAEESGGPRSTLEAAVRCLEATLAAEPRAAHGWANLGAAYAAAGQAHQAQQCLAQAAKLEPRSAPIGYAAALQRLHCSEGMDPDGARDHLAGAAADMAAAMLQPKSEEGRAVPFWIVRTGLALVSFAQGRGGEDGGQAPKQIAERAMSNLKQAAEEAPDEAQPWLHLGRLSLTTLQLEDAVLYLKTAMARGHSSAGAWSNLGVALQLSGSPQQAEAAYKQAFAVSPEQEAPAVLANLGSLYAQQGSVGEAHESLAGALKLRPDYAPALNNLGLLLASQGKFQEAAAVFHRAAAADPHLRAATDNRARAAALLESTGGGLPAKESSQSNASLLHGPSGLPGGPHTAAFASWQPNKEGFLAPPSGCHMRCPTPLSSQEFPETRAQSSGSHGTHTADPTKSPRAAVTHVQPTGPWAVGGPEQGTLGAHFLPRIPPRPASTQPPQGNEPFPLPSIS